MNRTEFLAAIKGKPTPYTTPGGATVDLRPLSLPERLSLFSWHAENDKEPGYGQKLRVKYFALGVCNGDADPMFNEDEVLGLAIPAVDFDAIADEVARRALLMTPEKTDPGKDSPATPS